MWTRSTNDLRQRGQVSALLIARQATPHIDYGVRLVHPIEGGAFGGRKGLTFRNSRCQHSAISRMRQGCTEQGLTTRPMNLILVLRPSRWRAGSGSSSPTSAADESDAGPCSRFPHHAR